jgi:predicted enzyme related to lactoylglutathione lyase
MQLVVFPTKDLDRGKKIFSTLLGTDPYVDGPYYVGFRAGGLEVGLDPNGTGGPICYWIVKDIAASAQSLVAAGATPDEAPHDVGRGLLIAKVKDADGNVVGLRTGYGPASEPDAEATQNKAPRARMARYRL